MRRHISVPGVSYAHTVLSRAGCCQAFTVGISWWTRRRGAGSNNAAWSEVQADQGSMPLLFSKGPRGTFYLVCCRIFTTLVDNFPQYYCCFWVLFKMCVYWGKTYWACLPGEEPQAHLWPNAAFTGALPVKRLCVSEAPETLFLNKVYLCFKNRTKSTTWS